MGGRSNPCGLRSTAAGLKTLARGSALVTVCQMGYTLDMKDPKFDAERKAMFLLAYARSTEITAAAAAARVSRVTVYNHLNSDPEFAADFERVDGEIDEMMMGQLKKVAIDGVKKTTFDKDGNKVSETMIYDNRCLLAWLQRRRRKEWGNHVQVDQKVEATHTVKHEVQPAKLNREQRNRVRDLLDTLPPAPPSNN